MKTPKNKVQSWAKPFSWPIADDKILAHSPGDNGKIKNINGPIGLDFEVSQLIY